MITMNLSRAFFTSICTSALFSTFREFSGRLHWAVNFWKGILQVPPARVRPLLRVTEKMQETGLTGFHPYPGQEYQTICRCHSLGGSTFSSDILRLWVLFWSSAWALDLRRSATWTNQAAVFESLLTLSYAFYPHNRHWHTRYNWHLGCSYLPQTAQSSFDEIREYNVDGLCLKNSPFLIALIKVGSNWTATVASPRHST